jgi:class 3 adenylate cyclase/tetratricopeptide (TPR) repeat protein
MVDRERLLDAIAAQEQLRGSLPDDIVDTAIAALTAQLDRSGVQRRGMATVLFADVAGFTALSEDRDAEVVAELMNDLWESVDRAVIEHGGTVDKHIGDAVMGVWGAAAAREDDPERAVRAALALRDGFEQFRQRHGLDVEVRVGVNTGPVLFGAVGVAGERSVTGDAVNVASRIEHVAPHGEVLVSHDTYRHVVGVFDVRPQDPVTVKGKSEPLQTYVVDRAKPRSFRLRSRGVEGVETPMVGRAAELAVLQDAFEAVVAGNGARVVTVVGEAGAGKSRLLDEFSAWLDLRPEAVLYLKGRSIPDLKAVPRGLLRELFAYRFDITEDEPGSTAAAKLRAGFAPLDAEQAEITSRWLGFDLPESGTGQRLTGSADFGLIAQSHLLRFLAAVLDQDPTVMLLEDIHWADADSLDVVCELVAHLRAAPLLVVAVARPIFDDLRPGWAAGPGAARRLDLQPLTDRETRALVTEILRLVEDLPSEVVDLVVGHADGNPFYVEELVKMLVDQHVVRTDRGSPWKVAGDRLQVLSVPATLAGVLQARLDALPDDERRAVQHASVVGRTFWDESVAALLAHGTAEPSQVNKTLDRVSARELVWRSDRSTFSGCEEFKFKHALLRDAAYETVLLRQRPPLHAAAAAWMQHRAGDRLDEHLASIAEHLVLAGDHATAAQLFERAAARAAATGSPTGACVLYRRVLECWESDGLGQSADATRVRIELGHHLDRADDLEQAVAHLERAAVDAAASGDAALEALALGRLASAEMHLGHFPTAAGHLAAALPLSEEVGGRVLAEVVVVQGSYVESQNAADAMPYALRALELSREVGDVDLELRALNNLSICAARQLQFDEAAEWVAAGLDVARRTDNPFREATLRGTLAALAHVRASREPGAELSEVIELYRQAVAVSERLGHTYGVMISLVNQAQAEVESGRAADGRAHARRCLEETWARRRIPDSTFAVVVLAQAAIASGDPATGLAMIGTARAEPQGGLRPEEIERILDVHGLDPSDAERLMADGDGASFEGLIEALLADESEQQV